MIPLLLFLLGCVLVYVGTVQAAYSVLMRFSLRLIAEADRESSHLERYLEEPLKLFVPARLLVGIVTVVAGGLFVMLYGGLGWRAVGAAMATSVVFYIVCEELLPYLIVRKNPQAVLAGLLPSFTVMAALVAPLSTPIVQLLAKRARAAAASIADAEAHEGGGDAVPAPDAAEVESDEQRRLLRSIVDFGDTLVREVMTPRPDIAAIRADATLIELVAFYRHQEYSRIPVFDEDLDNIAGIVFVKDLLKFDGDLASTPVTAIMRPAFFVPETKKVQELLKELQQKQLQLAIVVDEYGGTAGLVTLEDLLEEIVGEIRDEYDVETEPVVDQGDGSFIVSGKVNVDEVADRLGLAIHGEGFETMGGYLLSHIGRVPAVGERFEVDGLEVEVLEAEKRRVHKVRVRKTEPAVN